LFEIIGRLVVATAPVAAAVIAGLTVWTIGWIVLEGVPICASMNGGS
jgi:hypothetical protein